MKTPDIRWHQRLQSFSAALEQLAEAVQLSKQRELTRLGKQGLIQVFEFTHELAWNVLKDYFDYQGGPAITGSRDAARGFPSWINFRRRVLDGDDQKSESNVAHL